MTSDEVLEPLQAGGMVSTHSLVIDLEDVRIRVGRVPYKVQSCKHQQLIYCEKERRVWCEQCERTIDGFEAFMILARRMHRFTEDMASKKRVAEEIINERSILRAAKALSRAWRGNTKAVACPHCRKGLLPEDFANGSFSWASKEYEMARRKQQENT